MKRQIKNLCTMNTLTSLLKCNNFLKGSKIISSVGKDGGGGDCLKASTKMNKYIASNLENFIYRSTPNRNAPTRSPKDMHKIIHGQNLESTEVPINSENEKLKINCATVTQLQH